VVRQALKLQTSISWLLNVRHSVRKRIAAPVGCERATRSQEKWFRPSARICNFLRVPKLPLRDMLSIHCTSASRILGILEIGH
jgi:hypothetical protein